MPRNSKTSLIALILTALLLAGAGQAVGEKKPDKTKEKAMDTSCVATAKGPLTPGGKAAEPEKAALPAPALAMKARVGQPAPDFEANAFVNGGFKNLRLSEFKGKWTVLCFYPGDFTFV